VTGLDATEHIMAYCPTPILIVSSSVNRGEVFKTYDALAAGAVYVLEKPRGDERDGDWERKLINAVRMVARIRVITHPRARLPRRVEQARTPPGAPLVTETNRQEPQPDVVRGATLVAIGISTGGPAAIARVLSLLGRDFPSPILLVLHISPLFSPALVEWLSTQSPLPVRLARDGERLPRGGVVLLAPPDRHLVVRGEHLALVDTPERHSCRPSVDVLFESLAGRPSTVACLMTGMGRDGADGLLRIRQGGGQTIAQDEASSIVFGMPREAIRLGAAERVLSLDEIPRALVAMCRPGGAT
jgi:two-component system chemotaxis response regulator CheB